MGSLSFEIPAGDELVSLQSTVCNKTNIFIYARKFLTKHDRQPDSNAAARMQFVFRSH